MRSNKNKVLEIYPTAQCWRWTGEYCIFETKTNQKLVSTLGYGSMQYSGWHKTERMAWKQAWFWIQESMLDKFEN